MTTKALSKHIGSFHLYKGTISLAFPNMFTCHLGQLLRFQEVGFAVANEELRGVQVNPLVSDLKD